jgi:hypothetical protein
VYKFTTVRNNINLISSQILDQIGDIVVACGHNFLKKKTKN